MNEVDWHSLSFFQHWEKWKLEWKYFIARILVAKAHMLTIICLLGYLYPVRIKGLLVNLNKDVEWPYPWC